MKWFSLDKTCVACGKTGPSVMAVNHGDQIIPICSRVWNEWLGDLFVDDPHGTIQAFLVTPEGCEDTTAGEEQ